MERPFEVFLAKIGYNEIWEGNVSLAAVPITVGIGAIIGAAVGWLLNYLYVWFILGERHNPRRGYPVHGAFAVAYSLASQSGIGKPIGKAKRGGFATWTVFQNAAVLWLKAHNCIFQLPFDREARSVLSVNDPRASGEYFRPEVVREKLRLPEAFDPPRGGIALAWERAPDNWKWIGQRQYRHQIKDRNLLIQRFENGLIVGFVPAGQNTDDKVVVWLVNGGAWQTVEVD